MSSVQARVLALSGALDLYAPQEDVVAFQTEMAAAQADWQMTIYGGGRHGFTDPIAEQMRELIPGVGYDPVLDRLSWAQALAFLDAAMRGEHSR